MGWRCWCCAKRVGVSARRHRRRRRRRRYRYTHIQTTQTAAAHLRRADRLRLVLCWHLGDFNDPFCATTQLTLVLSSEKEIINRGCYHLCV